MRHRSADHIEGGGSLTAADPGYEATLAREVANYQSVENVHDLPAIAHYWSNKYLAPRLLPFGFSNPTDFFLSYMSRVCSAQSSARLQFISIGAGNCDTEVGLIESLSAAGLGNFSLECLDVNPHMLERGQRLARERRVMDRIHFTQADVNAWEPRGPYDIVMANQSLHHFVELELLFDKVHESLAGGGFFLTSDMIGRNGHMRWPEALEVLNTLWEELPERYRYNHLLKRTEMQYENWDCSKEGFEGIRSQDILPLLIRTFHFELFLGFGNVIDVFIDRCFGHNFDPADPGDCAFIDKVHLTDDDLLERGAITPTHMIAAMTKTRPSATRTYKHITPEFCVRRTEG